MRGFRYPESVKRRPKITLLLLVGALIALALVWSGREEGPGTSGGTLQGRGSSRPGDRGSDRASGSAGIDTDPFSAPELVPDSARERRVRFVEGGPDGALTGEDLPIARIDGWLGVAGALVPVRGGLSDPVVLPVGSTEVWLLLHGRASGRTEIVVGAADDPEVISRPAPELAATVTGIARREGIPLRAGELVELDTLRVSPTFETWWDDKLRAPVFEGGRFFASLTGDAWRLRLAVLDPMDWAQRYVGPLAHPRRREDVLREGGHWDLGATEIHEPGVIARIKCTVPEGASVGAENRWLDLFIKKAGAPDHTEAQFSISVARAPDDWVEIRGTSPWPVFEAWARYGACRWRGPRRFPAGADLHVAFEATGTVVGQIIPQGAVPSSSSVRVEARGARQTRQGEVHPGGRFILADLPAGTWTVVVTGLGGRSVARPDVVVPGKASVGPIDIGQLRLPDVGVAVRELTVEGPGGARVRGARARLASPGGVRSRPVSGDGAIRISYPVDFDGELIVDAPGHVTRRLVFSTVSDVIRLAKGVEVVVLFPEPPSELFTEVPVELTAQARLRGAAAWGETSIGTADGRGVDVGTWPAGATLELRARLTRYRRHDDPLEAYVTLGSVRVPERGSSFEHTVAAPEWDRVRDAAR